MRDRAIGIINYIMTWRRITLPLLKRHGVKWWAIYSGDDDTWPIIDGILTSNRNRGETVEDDIDDEMSSGKNQYWR